MRSFFSLLLIFFSASLLAYPPMPESSSDKQTYFVRRVIELWKDQDYVFAKNLITNFIQKNPQSPFVDHFYAMLADLALESGADAEAYAYYSAIYSEAIQNEVIYKKWQALYNMGCYAKLYQESLPYVHTLTISNKGKFYFAIAALNEAKTLLSYPESKKQALTLLQEALDSLTPLLSDKNYQAKALIAEIYLLQNKAELASELLMGSINKRVEEPLLFKAAQMIDRSRALPLFEHLAQNSCELRSLAALEWLKIAIEENRLELVFHKQQLLFEALDTKYQPALHFYLAKYAFEKQDYLTAIAEIKKSLKEGLYEKEAIFILLKSAQEIGDLESAQIAYTIGKKKLDLQEELSFELARFYLKSDKVKNALSLFEKLLNEGKDRAILEKIHLEKITFLRDHKLWQACHAATAIYLDLFPDTVHKNQILRLDIDLSLQELALKTAPHLYEQLITDIEKGLHLFTEEEKRDKERIMEQAKLKTISIEPLELPESFSLQKETPKRLELLSLLQEESSLPTPLPMLIESDFKGARDISPYKTLSLNDFYETHVEYAPKQATPGYIFKITLQQRENTFIKPMQQNYFFLLDRSNSTSRTRYLCNKMAIASALEKLQANDKFNILIFDNQISRLSTQAVEATEENLLLAQEFLNKQGHGGHFATTKLYSALNEILPESISPNETYTTILLSHGDSYLSAEKQGKTIDAWTKRNAGKMTLHSLVSGKGNNSAFLALLSSFNKGKCVYCKPAHLSDNLQKLMLSIKQPIGKEIMISAVADKHGMISLPPKCIGRPLLHQNRPFVIYGSTNRLSDFVLFLQGKKGEDDFSIKKTISFEKAQMGSVTLERTWTQLLAQKHYALFFEDGNKEHLMTAKALLEPLHLPLSLIDSFKVH